MLTIDVISIFPELVTQYAQAGLLGKAQKRKLLRVLAHNPRDAATDRHRTVDALPYGGGAGMVLQALPILKTAGGLLGKKSPGRSRKIVVLSAKGALFTQRTAMRWAKDLRHLVLITGRYEGIDERVKRVLGAQEFSVGSYVLSDGDVAAMVVISAIARLLPGVIKWESLEEESHWNLLKRKEESLGRGVEYPHYTRPESFMFRGKRYRVPKVLLSGDHKKIASWRASHTT